MGVVVALALIGLLAPAPAPGAEPPGAAALLRELRSGGLIVYFRHADTDHGQQDVRGAPAGDCARQRNLSARGRDHARDLGAAIRALELPIGRVLASPLCRTVETALLIFGTAERSPAVRDPGPAPPGSPDRFPALRALLSTAPPAGTNLVIVGHGYAFWVLAGGQVLEEGEAAVVRPVPTGLEVVARLDLRRWRALGQTP